MLVNGNNEYFKSKKPHGNLLQPWVSWENSFNSCCGTMFIIQCIYGLPFFITMLNKCGLYVVVNWQPILIQNKANLDLVFERAEGCGVEDTFKLMRTLKLDSSAPGDLVGKISGFSRIFRSSSWCISNSYQSKVAYQLRFLRDSSNPQ